MLQDQQLHSDPCHEKQARPYPAWPGQAVRADGPPRARGGHRQARREPHELIPQRGTGSLTVTLALPVIGPRPHAAARLAVRNEKGRGRRTPEIGDISIALGLG